TRSASAGPIATSASSGCSGPPCAAPPRWSRAACATRPGPGPVSAAPGRALARLGDVTDASALLDLVLADDGRSDPAGEAILDAALHESLACGLRRTNVDVVAKRAGVSRATLYRRFDGKDALVQAVLVRECRRFFTSVAAATDGLSTVEERLVEGFVVGVRY